MYECVIVKSYRGADEIIDAEGELDNESDVSDIDMDEFRSRRDSSSNSVTSSIHGEIGSPMVVDESEWNWSFPYEYHILIHEISPIILYDVLFMNMLLQIWRNLSISLQNWDKSNVRNAHFY